MQNIDYIWETLAFTGMDKQQRHKILESVMWDYSISAGEMEELLDGKIDKAGHYTREQLFARMLTGLPWFTVIRLVPVEKVRTLLTDNVIGILWPESIRKKYEYVRKRLQEALPDAG